MSIAFSLRIFVADKDPDRLRIVEKSNWIGKALLCQRRCPAYRTSQQFHQPNLLID